MSSSESTVRSIKIGALLWRLRSTGAFDGRNLSRFFILGTAAMVQNHQWRFIEFVGNLPFFSCFLWDFA